MRAQTYMIFVNLKMILCIKLINIIIAYAFYSIYTDYIFKNMFDYGIKIKTINLIKLQVFLKITVLFLFYYIY